MNFPFPIPQQIISQAEEVLVASCRNSRSVSPDGTTLLPPNFVPGPFTVIIGTGTGSTKSASGNMRLRARVQAQLERYSAAKIRAEKSSIVTDILHGIQSECSGVAAFAKFDGKNWLQLSEVAAREKVTSVFRDMLSHKYKSATKNKVQRKKAMRKINPQKHARKKVSSENKEEQSTLESAMHTSNPDLSSDDVGEQIVPPPVPSSSMTLCNIDALFDESEVADEPINQSIFDFTAQENKQSKTQKRLSSDLMSLISDDESESDDIV
jgi:hypothetical protein